MGQGKPLECEFPYVVIVEKKRPHPVQTSEEEKENRVIHVMLATSSQHTGRGMRLRENIVVGNMPYNDVQTRTTVDGKTMEGGE